MSHMIDYTTLGANYVYDKYNYTSVQSQVYQYPAISGTHTDVELILFQKQITAKKSGVFFCYASLVGYCASGGTAFLNVYIKPTTSSSWQSVTASAFVPADVLTNGKGENRLLAIGMYPGTKGTTYDVRVFISRGNASNFYIESLAGAGWGCIEL